MSELTEKQLDRAVSRTVYNTLYNPPTIDYDAFCKVDIRVATIKDALIHEQADNLLVLKLDIGEPQPRTVCAGIRAHYKIENLIGKQVLYVANLEKRKMRGVESEGMILAALDGETGTLALTMVTTPVAPGTKVK